MFWHSHILETAAYLSTCVHLFGQYVHHKPRAPVVTMKTYWDAHHKHFPKDALECLFSRVSADKDDGDESDEADEITCA